MDQPRISPPTATIDPSTNKKRSLESSLHQDFEEPLPTKKSLKNFENSLGFSQTCFSNSKNFSNTKEDSRLQTQKLEQQMQELNFSTELRKVQLRTSPEDKFQKYRSMLPGYLVTKLHPNYEQMIQVANRADMLLQSRSKVSFMQSFENIKNELRIKFSLNINLELFFEVNFFVENSYKFFKDPLGNLVISLEERHDSSPLRKYKLKKQVYSYIIKRKSQKQSFVEFYEQIEVKTPDLFQKQTFFPTKIMQQPKQSPNKLPQKFINHLQQSIYQKEKTISKIDLSTTQNTDQVDIKWFANELQTLYQKHQVTNMYRANIVQWFQKQGMNPPSIILTLQKIQNTNLYLHLMPVPNKHPIYSLKSSQRVPLIQKLT